MQNCTKQHGLCFGEVYAMDRLQQEECDPLMRSPLNGVVWEFRVCMKH